MKKVNVFGFELVANICNQKLREIERNPNWSMAHVVMNPGDESLLHAHKNDMYEVYVVTKGSGHLILGQDILSVKAGNVVLIPPSIAHKLINSGIISIEHLVFAFPPFKPDNLTVFEGNPKSEYDNHLLDTSNYNSMELELPRFEKGLDEASIIPYPFQELGISIAFGWVSQNPPSFPKAHFHKKSTEWAYIVEGSGLIEVGGLSHIVREGDWIKIERGERHAFHSFKCDDTTNLVIVCVQFPMFDKKDYFVD